jgi:16S rRNA (guanine527-N7)-methyltransferase
VSHDDRAPLALPDSAPLPVPDGFAARLSDLGAIVSDETLAGLGRYLGHLLAMNEQVNLTAIKDADSAWERHVLDALTLLPLVPPGARLLDVGSGGGIPGLPLAIARPDLRVTLCESIKKKASFLSSVVAAMTLPNVTVVPERVEQLGDRRGAFDVVTARAVARLSALAPLTVPFARPGGLVLLIKGQKAEEELAEARSVLKKLRATHERTVPTPTGRIIVLRR